MDSPENLDVSDRTKAETVKLLFLCSLLAPPPQVKSEYAQLKETLGAVTQERDLALWERNQLQGKLENLEQVLKVRKLPPRADTVCHF